MGVPPALRRGPKNRPVGAGCRPLFEAVPAASHPSAQGAVALAAIVDGELAFSGNYLALRGRLPISVGIEHVFLPELIGQDRLASALSLIHGGPTGNRTPVRDPSRNPSLTCVAGLPFRRGFPVSPECPPRKSRPSLLRLLGLVQPVWLAPRGYSGSFPVNGRNRFRRLRRPRYRSQLTFARLVKAD